MILKCDCCGFTQDFADLEAAFEAGWDAPPHFTGYVACTLCPAVAALGRIDHRSVHERWLVEGRPAEFDQETCLAPEHRVPEQQLNAVRTAIEQMSQADIEAFKALFIFGEGASE